MPRIPINIRFRLVHREKRFKIKFMRDIRLMKVKIIYINMNNIFICATASSFVPYFSEWYGPVDRQRPSRIERLYSASGCCAMGRAPDLGPPLFLSLVFITKITRFSGNSEINQSSIAMCFN